MLKCLLCVRDLEALDLFLLATTCLRAFQAILFCAVFFFMASLTKSDKEHMVIAVTPWWEDEFNNDLSPQDNVKCDLVEFERIKNDLKNIKEIVVPTVPYPSECTRKNWNSLFICCSIFSVWHFSNGTIENRSESYMQITWTKQSWFELFENVFLSLFTICMVWLYV